MKVNRDEEQFRPRDMYFMEINSQMIAIVFNINLSTTLFNQTEQRTSLVCFQTFSIGKNVPCLFVFDPCANRHHPYRWLQHAFQISQHHVCSEIFILHNKTLNTNWWRLKTTISLVTLLYFFVDSDISCQYLFCTVLKYCCSAGDKVNFVLWTGKSQACCMYVNRPVKE